MSVEGKLDRSILRIQRIGDNWVFYVTGTTGVHTVYYRDGKWLCSCPAGIFAGKEKVQNCRHIRMASRIRDAIMRIEVEENA